MIYLIIASLIWAFSFSPLKGNLVDLDSSFVAWARLVIAFLVFLPFFRLKSLTFRLSMHLFFLGAFQCGLFYVCYTEAFQYLDGYQVALFTIFMPIYVTIFDDIDRRKIDWVNLGMALLAVFGAAIISYEQAVSFDHLFLGFVLMQISNICFAFGQIEYRRLRRFHAQISDRQVYSILFIGAIVLTSISTTWRAGWGSFELLTATHIWTLLFLGVLATGLGFFLWNVGAITTHVGVLAVMNNIKIPLAIFVSVTIFHEQAHIARLILGGGIMVLAVILAEYFRIRGLKAIKASQIN